MKNKGTTLSRVCSSKCYYNSELNLIEFCFVCLLVCVCVCVCVCV